MTDEELQIVRSIDALVLEIRNTVELMETKIELMQKRLDFYQEMFEVTRTRRTDGDH